MLEIAVDPHRKAPLEDWPDVCHAHDQILLSCCLGLPMLSPWATADIADSVLGDCLERLVSAGSQDKLATLAARAPSFAARATFSVATIHTSPTCGREAWQRAIHFRCLCRQPNLYGIEVPLDVWWVWHWTPAKHRRCLRVPGALPSRLHSVNGVRGILQGKNGAADKEALCSRRYRRQPTLAQRDGSRDFSPTAGNRLIGPCPRASSREARG